MIRAWIARWWWLLTYGRWHGYHAMQVADRYEIKSLATRGPAPYYEHREWWNKYDTICTCDNEQGCNVHDKACHACGNGYCDGRCEGEP